MSIVQNKKAFHDYFIEEKYEAGIALEGWEVKAVRDNRAQLKESYVIIQSFCHGAGVPKSLREMKLQLSQRLRSNLRELNSPLPLKIAKNTRIQCPLNSLMGHLKGSMDHGIL